MQLLGPLKWHTIPRYVLLAVCLYIVNPSFVSKVSTFTVLIIRLDLATAGPAIVAHYSSSCFLSRVSYIVNSSFVTVVSTFIVLIIRLDPATARLAKVVRNRNSLHIFLINEGNKVRSNNEKNNFPSR